VTQSFKQYIFGGLSGRESFKGKVEDSRIQSKHSFVFAHLVLIVLILGGLRIKNKMYTRSKMVE
jgi:hypothetical protein